MAIEPLIQQAQNLVDDIGGFFYDPLGFVYFAFPWREVGTILETEAGPDPWQVEILEELGKGAINPKEACQIAVASGHGIGKTALVAWIVLWFISTRPHPQIIVTANTKTQLNTKTWRELAKWHKLAINRDWFQWTATRFYHLAAPATWFATAIQWNINRPEAFAGTHEEHVLMLFDEASAIDDVIWETAEGAMTTPGAMWVAFGNPTRNTGRFQECFGRLKHRWKTQQIDSRTSNRVDKAKVQEWIDDFGEDSDFVRVRVRGVFPRAGSAQFIAGDMVENCRHYKAQGFEHMPKLLGVDIARFGDDQTVLTIRQGRRVFPQVKYRGKDTMQTAGLVADMMSQQNPQMVMIDGVGVGGGVIDRLRQLGHVGKIIDVNAGAAPNDDRKYANKRAEMWGKMRDYLKEGAEIPDDPELHSDLTGPEYGFTPKQQIQLEKKEDMKRRGLASPDCADSLALTFAFGFRQLPEVMKDNWKPQPGIV
jgi:hypothetical protein